MRRASRAVVVGCLLGSPLTPVAPAAEVTSAPTGGTIDSQQDSRGQGESRVAGPDEDEEGDSGQTTDPADTPVFYETTTVTARPVSSSSGSVTVITAEELEASGARSGTEVLREVPGLHLLSTGGRTGITHAWIRGGDPNFTLILLDGIPLNDTTDRQGGAVNLEELPRGLIDRAEVVRGPRSSFYGMSSLSGVVQLFSPRGGPGPLRAALGAELGNADLRRGFARLSGPAGQGGWSAGMSYDQERFRIARDRFEQIDAWANADIVLGADTTLALNARFATGEQDDYADGSGGPVFGTGEVRHTEHDDLALGARLKLGESSGGGHVLSAGLSRRAQDRLTPAIPPVVPESEESTTYTRLRLSWLVPIRRSDRTQIDVGASGEGEWAKNSSLLKLPPEFGGLVPGDYEENRVSGGVFGAFRRERGAFLYEVALRLDGATGLGPQLNPHLGIVWSPGSGATRLRASAGRATKLPSFFALASPPALGGNPDLKPERTVGGEIGLEHGFRSAGLTLGATVFRQEYRDLVDFDFDSFLHVNRARVRTQGVEMTAGWQLHETLRIAVEATYLDARDLSGDPLLREPRWLGGGSLTWRPADSVSLRLDARAVSHYLDRQIPVPDETRVPSYSVLGLAGSWRFLGDWSVRARLDNLSDRGYESLIGFPGPPRSVWVGLGWDRRGHSPK